MNHVISRRSLNRMHFLCQEDIRHFLPWSDLGLLFCICFFSFYNKTDLNLTFLNDFHTIHKHKYLLPFIMTFSISCQLVRKLINVPEPMALEMIDKFRCVALCQRELYVFDLNTGELLSKLKGTYIYIYIFY